MKRNTLEEFLNTAATDLDALDAQLVQSVIDNDYLRVCAALNAGANMYLKISKDYNLCEYVYHEVSGDIQSIFEMMVHTESSAIPLTGYNIGTD
jgi:L-lysine 2,3-aminomutase